MEKNKIGKYVYWFKIRQSGTYRQGFYDSKVYFSSYKDALRHQKEHITTFYDSTKKNLKAEYHKPKMHKILFTSVKKNIHIN